MSIWGWLALGAGGVIAGGLLFWAWAARATARQTSAWLEHFDDEWEVGG